MQRKMLLKALALFVVLLPAAQAVSETRLELRGKVHYTAARFRFLRVAIYHVESPFTATTLTDPGGEFHFRGLAAGTYTVSVVRRGLGEIRRSVVVTPALADKKGIVRAEIEFSPAEAIQSKSVSTVSRNQLTVPHRAILKYAEAEQKLSRHDVAGARKVLLEAVKAAPQYTAAWNFLGVLSYQEGDLPKAEEYFRHAVSLERDSFEPNVNLGGVLLAQRRIKEAFPINQKAVELRPKDALANSQIGMNYYYQGQYEQAVGYLETAQAADPSHFSMPQLFLSRIYERRGDKAAAANELEALLALRPDTPQAEQWKRRLRRLRSQ